MELKLLNGCIRKQRIQYSTQLLFGIKSSLGFYTLHSILFFIFLLVSTSSKAQNCTVNANIDLSICANEELLLSGTKGGTLKFPGTTTWTQISGPSAIITSPNSLTTAVTGIIGGNVYTFRLSATCGDNAKIFDDVEYTVKIISSANAGPNLGPLCPGTGNLAANALLAGETGQWTIVSTSNYAGIIITDPSSPTSGYTLQPSGVGTTTLRWTVTNTNGCSSFDEMTITNRGGLSTVTAGPDQTLGNCYSTTQSTVLAGTFGGGFIAEAQGKWTVVTGPNIPIFADDASNTTPVSNLIEGVYTLKWTVTNLCAIGLDTMQITVPEPVGNNSNATISPGNTIYCDARTTIVLTGSTPVYNNESVTWTQTSGPPATIVSPNSPTTTITGLDGTSSYTFTYTINNTVTGCTSSNSAATNFATPASLNVTSSSPIIGACDSSNSTITCTDSGTGTVQYSIVSAPAGFPGVPTNYVNLGSSPATINGLTEPGTYIVRVRKSANGVGCTDIFQDVTLIVSKTPTPSSGGTNQKLGCGVTTTSLAGNVPAVGIGSWNQIVGPNTATIADKYDPLTAISNLISGFYIFRWEISGGPACTNSQNDVSVKVVSTPPAQPNAGTAQTVCANSSVTLSGSAKKDNEEGLWTVSPSVGVVFSPDATTRDATVTGLTANSVYTFTWTVSNTCGSSADDVIITTNSTQGPIQSNAGDDQCLENIAATAALAGNDPSPGAGLWTVISGSGTSFTNATLYNTAVTGLTPGVYEFQWTISNGGCTTSSNNVKITVSAAVSTANAGSDQNICGTSVTITANVPTVGTGIWTQVSGPIDAIITDPNNASTTVTSLIDGSYIFKWSISNGCNSSTDDVQINVSTQTPIAPLAGSDQSICGVTSVTMAGNSVATGNGLWSVVSGPNIPAIPNPSSPTTTITGLEAGTYIFRWTSKAGAYCGTLYDDVAVDVTPNANAGSDQSLCFANSVSLNGNEGSVGTWTQIGTTPNVATITTTSSSSAIASGLISGTYTFNYAITPTGTCTPLSDTVDITIYSAASAADAGVDQIFCGATQFILNGNDPGSLTGTWTVVSGPTGGSFFPNSNTPNAIYINPGNGTYVFSWTIANGSCSSTDEVRIENPAQPSTADAGPDQDQVCSFQTTMNANNPIEGVGNWTMVSKPLGATDPNILNPILYNTRITSLDPVIYPGIYVFRWTISNGTCPSTSDDVSVTIYQASSIANAGPDQNLCGSVVTNLNATPLTIGTGKWTKISGPPVIIVNDTSPTSVISTLTIGTYEFEWTTTNSVCTSSDQVSITNNPSPTTASTAGTLTSICKFEEVKLVGNVPTVGTGLWTQTAGNPAIIVDPTSPTTLASGTDVGSYSFEWTISGTGCPSSSEAVTISILQLPTIATVGSDQVICDGDTATLEGNTPTNGTGTWTIISGGAGATITDPNNPTTTVTGLPIGTTRLRWTISNGVCADYLAGMNITVNPKGQINKPNDQIVCNNAATSIAFTSSNTDSITSYTWINDNTAIGLGASGSGNLSFVATNITQNSISATITVTPTFTNGGTSCVGPSESFTITVNPSGQVNPITAQELCNGATTNAIAFSTTNPFGTTSYTWTNNNTSIGLGANGSGDIPPFTATNTATNPVIATITVTPTISDGTFSCAGTPVNFTITINPKPTVNSASAITMCNGVPLNYIITSATAGTSFIWSRATVTDITEPGVNNQTDNPINEVLTNTTNAPIIVQYVITPTGPAPTSCSGNPFDLDVTVNPIPNVTTNPTSQLICSGTTTNIGLTTTITGATVTYSWTAAVTSGSATGFTNGSGSIIAEKITNTGTTQATVTYTITPAIGTCTGNPITVDIFINPSGNVIPSGNQTACNASTTAAITLSSTNTDGATTYDWTNNNPAIGLALSGTGNIPSFTATNPGTSPIFGNIIVIPTYSKNSLSCVGTSDIFTYTVNPTGQVNQPSNQSFCNSQVSTVTFTTQNTGGSTTYNWTNDIPSIGLAASGSGDITFTATNATPNPLTASIIVTPTFTNGGVSCSGPSKTFTITITPSGQVEPIGDQELCTEDTTTAILFTTNNPLGTTTYTWTNNDTSIGLGASGSGDIPPFMATNTGTDPVTATITVTPLLNDGTISCTGIPETFTIIVNPKPTVTSASTKEICSGTSVNYTITSATAGTTYVWNRATVAGITEAGVTGQTANPINEILTNTTNDPIIVRYIITPIGPGATSCAGTPFNLDVTVNPTADVIPSPISELICSGTKTNIDLSTATTGGTVTYSWTPALLTGSANGFANGSGLKIEDTITNTGDDLAFVEYTVTPSFNGCPGVPENVLININPSGNVNQPSNQVVCNSSNTTNIIFTTTNTINHITTYAWTNDTPSIGLLASGTGNIAPFTAVNTGTSPVMATITVTPTFTADGLSCTGTPKSFIITVNPTAQVNPVASQVLCNGSATTAFTFATANTGGTTSYTWTNDTPSIGLVASGIEDIASFTAVNLGTAPVVATITVTPIFKNGGIDCSGPTQTFTITVNPTAQVKTIADQVVCNGDSTTAVAFLTTNTGGTTTYSWTNDTPSIGLVASGTGNIASFTAVNNGTSPVIATITVTPIFNNGSIDCTDAAKTFTLTVNPTAQVNSIISQVVCNGSATTAVTFATANTGGITTYAWTNDTPSIGLIVSGTGNIVSFTAVNTGTAPVTATIIVTPTFNNGSVDCLGASETFTITVNPTAQVNPIADQEVCGGSPTTAISFATANTGGTTAYTWINDTVSIGLASSGTGDIASFTTVNTSTNPVIATIIVTPTFNNGSVNCSGPTETFTITVNPTPIGIPIDKSICSGEAVNQVLATNLSIAGTTFTYPAPVVTGGITGGNARTVGSVDDITDVLVNPTRLIHAATYTVTPTSPDGCVGAPYEVKITVTPTPEGVPASKTICSGEQVNQSLEVTPALFGTTYTYPAPLITGGITGGVARPVGSSADITDTLINSTHFPQTATYTITPTSLIGCIGNSFTVVITVNPTPIGVDDLKTICSGEAVNLNLKTTPIVFGTTYTYLAPVVTGGITGGNARPVDSTADINDVLINPTGFVQTATYTVTPKSPDSCIGQPFTIEITVNPTPIGTDEFKTIYSGEAVNQNLRTNPITLGTTFTYPTPLITGSLTGGTPRIIGSHNDITDILINPSSFTQTATYTVTPTSSQGCIGNPFNVEVKVLAVFVGVTNNKTICSGDAVNQDLKTSPMIPGTTFTYPAPVATGGITGGQARLIGTPDDITDVLVNPTRFVQKATYTVTPQGANGFVGAPFLVEILVEPTPDAPVASTTLQPTCTTPTGTITVSSPIGITYNYSIDGIDYSNTSGVFTAVSSGNYTVSVKTSLGCVSLGTNVTVDPQPITPSTPIVNVTQGTCSLITGSVLLTGLPAGNCTITQTGTVNASYNGNTPELSISGLVSGSYNFTVTNSVGCSSLPTSDVKINNVICAIADSNPTPINGYTGGIAIANVLDNDVLNNLAIIPSDVVISVVPSSIPVAIVFDTATGQVSVNTQTKSGTYTFDYTICEVVNPSNCSTATITIAVASASIVANDDTNPIPVYGVVGGVAIANVLDNDELNGTAVIPSEVVIRILPNAVPPELIFNQTTGEVSIKPGTPANLYSFDYTICEVKNPLNCDTATVIVDVEVPTIALVKTVEFIDEDNDGNAREGETLAYKFTVTNTGSQPLTNITITDPLVGLVISGGPISLGVGESDSSTFTAQYSLTQPDINRGNVTNQATVSGTSPELIVVTDLSDNSNNAENDPTIQIISGCTIEVNNAMSPNDDGTNDVFYIRGIECYPNNTVQIFNRWGVLVYEEVGYNNKDKAFIGYSKGRKAEYKKDKLPSGTYFYIIKYTDFNLNTHELVKFLYIETD
jgi:gliding motility-associated-like protein